MLNFSAASERNRQPIWDRLMPLIESFSVSSVLEVGSGSGQHALFFCQHRPELKWQCTEMEENCAALHANLEGSALPAARVLDVYKAAEFPRMDMMYSANTLHIMAATAVDCFFRCAGKWVRAGGLLVVYGPFRYQGSCTSESNAEFDRWLRARDMDSGLRDFEMIDRLATEAGFELLKDYPMPANNQLLVWKRQAGENR